MRKETNSRCVLPASVFFLLWHKKFHRFSFSPVCVLCRYTLDTHRKYGKAALYFVSSAVTMKVCGLFFPPEFIIWLVGSWLECGKIKQETRNLNTIRDGSKGTTTTRILSYFNFSLQFFSLPPAITIQQLCVDDVHNQKILSKKDSGFVACHPKLFFPTKFQEMIFSFARETGSTRLGTLINRRVVYTTSSQSIKKNVSIKKARNFNDLDSEEN